MDETSPLGIFLVKSGSKGDRLLYRYPCGTDENKESAVKRNMKNPYAIAVPDDHLGASKPLSRTAQCDHTLDGFPDQVLAKLFACQQALCGRRFELKVKDVRFVGHPIYMAEQSRSHSGDNSCTKFHVVFALRATANHTIVDQYHEFSKRIAIGLKHEEERCGYLSSQAKIMLRCLDKMASMTEADGEHLSAYHDMLSCSTLANDLRKIYEDTKNLGEVHLRINKWIILSYCLPEKVHRLYNKDLNIDQETLLNTLKNIKPYHGLLLLVDGRELSESLPLDSSPSLLRLLNTGLATPLKSFKELALDCDLTLVQVFRLAAHLIYWAKAALIYPICVNNVYILAPNAPTYRHHPLVEKFAETFPGHSLLSLMSVFSLPTSLSNLFTPLRTDQIQQARMVAWLLQHRLIMQLHTYVYLVASLDSSAATTSSTPDWSPVENGLLAGLSAEEQAAILALPAASNLEDLKEFDRMCKYFRGKHHLEEMMYRENMRRSQILTIIEKFRGVLVTVQHGDPTISIFYSS